MLDSSIVPKDQEAEDAMDQDSIHSPRAFTGPARHDPPHYVNVSFNEDLALSGAQRQ